MVPRSTIYKFKRKFFHLFFYIIISSPIPSNILQHDTDILEEQCCEMQRRYEEEQQLQAYLEKMTEAYHIEYMA